MMRVHDGDIVKTEEHLRKSSLDLVWQRINSIVDDFSMYPTPNPNARGVYEDFPLHKVAIWGDIQSAEVLLANGADINAAGEDNDTPLHRAVAGKQWEMVKFLMLHGADRNRINRYGEKAIDDSKFERGC